MPGFALLAQPWWVAVLWMVVLGHITNMCVTLYLHRSATHEGVKYHGVVEHVMRLWLWLTTGMKTREWVACHRKHHAFSDREGDPHSPVQEGLLEIVFGGVFFYREAVQDKEMIEKYGKGCPDDWAERNIYTRFPFAGISLMLVLDLYLFGVTGGLVAWSGMAVWIPIFGNVINGVGHAIGYRNFDTKDHSRNIIPLGLWIVGEELHNNHHADPRSAKFRARWFELDIGWMYIKILAMLRLAEVSYARQMSAREFTERYYRRAETAVTDVVEDARAAVTDAVDDARAAASAASARAREAAIAASAAAGRAATTARDAAQAAGAALQHGKSLPTD
jgi:stearoyl-CoA desaturase (Delta-9 desaturase)